MRTFFETWRNNLHDALMDQSVKLFDNKSLTEDIGAIDGYGDVYLDTRATCVEHRRAIREMPRMAEEGMTLFVEKQLQLERFISDLDHYAFALEMEKKNKEPNDDDTWNLL